MRIAIFLPQNALGLSAMLIKNLCWLASRYAQEDIEQEATSKAQLNPAEVFTFSGDGTDAICLSGGPICADKALNEITTPDAVFLSAFWGKASKSIATEKPLVEKLEEWYEAGIPIAGFSNAPFFMAAAGLLNDKVATVYPPLAEEFADLYPKIQLRSTRAITDAGGLYCANGIASGCDLIVSVIEILFGPQIARRINQEFLIGFQRGYSLSSLEFDGQKYHSDYQIMTAQNWLEKNFKDEVSIDHLAADRGMSTRNFSRRFKAATGDSPGYYLQRVRMEVAKDLLINTEKQITHIAFDVGYNDSSYFSRSFKKQLHCLPNEYRKKYRHSSAV